MEIWRQKAQKLGEALAEELDIKELPIDPLGVAKLLDIEVQALPKDEKSVSGMLLQSNNNFGIMYATYIDQVGFQNFSIAHEIGHYSLPEHPEKLLRSGVHRSKAGFVSNEQCELEADHFASGLLMPRFLFEKALDKHQSGYNAVEKLANLCKTSLTATAIRYAQCTPDAVAVVVSEGTTVNYCFMSEEFKEIDGITWLKKGFPVPRGTITYIFNRDRSSVDGAHFDEGESSLSDWFGSEKNIKVYEEVKGLGAYGRTLTILTPESLPSTEDLEEEDFLEESWTPRFK